MLQYILPDGRRVQSFCKGVYEVIHNADGFADAASVINVCDEGKRDSDGCSIRGLLLQDLGISYGAISKPGSEAAA